MKIQAIGAKTLIETTLFRQVIHNAKFQEKEKNLLQDNGPKKNKDLHSSILKEVQRQKRQ